jgi:hypothetical protein
MSDSNDTAGCAPAARVEVPVTRVATEALMNAHVVARELRQAIDALPAWKRAAAADEIEAVRRLVEAVERL